MLRARVLSFGLILGLVFCLWCLCSSFGGWAGGLPGSKILLLALNTPIAVGITTLLFAMIYELMPTAFIAWRDV